MALALASREAARIIFVGLMTVTYPIGLVVSTLALGFMFYVVFTPLGFFMRLAGRDPLRLKARRDATALDAARTGRHTRTRVQAVLGTLRVGP